MSRPDDTSQLPGLEHYAMKPSYGRLTGVAVGCHAIQDAFLLIHGGVGCKDKDKHLLAHDWEQHCNLRQAWTEVDDEALIQGASQRVGPFVRSWQKRMGSGLVCVSSATFLTMAGEDLDAAVRQAGAGLDADVVQVVASGLNGDELDGYAALCRAVIERIDWRGARRLPKRVSIVGFWFDRYEGDQLGNLTQLNQMLQAVGLEPGPVLLSGVPYRALHEAARAQVLVRLPYLEPERAALDELWGVAATAAGPTVVDADLPMGFAATRRFLELVGRAAAVDPRLIAAYAERREARARQPLGKMMSRWRSQKVAVFAEPPLAAGTCAMLLELGLQPTLVGLRGTSLGGRAAFEGALARSGLKLDRETSILEAPSLALIRQRLRAELSAGCLDGVLGSATELNQLYRLPVDELVRGGGAPRGPFALEIGFPCWHHHALQQMPFMGYGGMVTLAQRLVDPPRVADMGRGRVDQ